MRAFADGSVDVLVATTVVEVGVDVPNATIMVIMDADRFGVSQLHQLRGRVGRGGKPGLCLLVTDSPPGSPARERLDAVAATVDGFVLSRLDLEQRREGNVLGAAQAGRKSGLKMLTLLQDEELIVQARGEAQALVDADPRLAGRPRPGQRHPDAAGRGTGQVPGEGVSRGAPVRSRAARRDAAVTRVSPAPPAGRPGGPAHPAYQRPGPGRAVRHARRAARPAGRGVRARPVRGLGRGGPGGAVPRRAAGAVRGGRPAGRPGDPGQHRRRSAWTGPSWSPTGWSGCSAAGRPGRTATTWPWPTRPTR